MCKMDKKITLKDIIETVNMAQSKNLSEFVIELNKENCSKNPKQVAEDIKNAYKHDAASPYSIDTMSGDGIVHVRFYKR